MSINQTRIFVADDVSDKGLQPLRDAGFAVEKKTSLAGDALRLAITECEGLVVRSETKVTAEVMDAAWGWAELVVMALKHHMAVLRPFQRNSLILPVIETPGHGSLPSGHATMAAMTAQLFIDVLELKPDSPRALALNRLARRIAFNRVVAGVHFPVDSLVGYTLGKHLACLLRAWGQGDKLPAAVTVDVGPAWTLPEAIEPDHTRYEPKLSSTKSGRLPVWGELWAAAKAEMADGSKP